MVRPNPVLTLTGVKGIETEKAVLFTVRKVRGEELEEPQTSWFPFSQIEKMMYSTNPEDLYNKDEIIVTEWIATKKGLI